MTVEEALRGELEELGKHNADIPTSTLAATALALAVEMDKPRNSATSKSMCAKAIYDAIDRLYALSPDEAQNDALDDLAAKRKERIAGVA